MGEPAESVSYEAYLAMLEASEVKLEFVDGVVYAMSGGTVEHARLSMRVGRALGRALEGRPCEVYSSDLKVRVDETNRTTFADATVICGPAEVSAIDRHAITNPTILVEVLSPSTEASDRGDKWRSYQRLSSLREYVLVSQGEPYVEVFEREEGGWRLRTYTAGAEIELPSQALSIPVDAIYHDPTVGA
jgi:Uma2 family endonuclease